MFEWLQHVRIQTIGNAINAALLITAFVVGLSSTMVFVEARHMSDTWERFDKGAATKAIVLGDLRAALGYGGMIHQISDFILRRDQRRLIDVQKSLRGATIALTRYQSLGTTQRERVALDTVNTAIDEHWARVSLAERLVLDGVAAEDIHLTSGIDDSAALEAFDTLEAELRAARQESGEQVYAATSRVIQLLVISSVIVGTLVAVLLIGFYLFTRVRLTRPLKALGDAMSRLAEGDHDAEIPELDRRDEIGAMARAVRIFRQNAIERRAAEAALQASEERLATILEIAPEAIMAVDAGGVVELFNKGAEAMFGHAAKEIIGQPFDLLIPMRFREIYKRYLRRFGNATTAVRMMDETGDISGLRADGSVFPAQASISKIDRNGEKIFTVIIRDITESTLARKRILDMAKFVNENPSPVLRVTAAGQVLYANPAAREFGALFESADLQVLGASLATTLRQALESGGRGELEFEAESRAFTFTICPVEDETYINLYGSEVTGRKQIQEQLNHAQKMEAVGRLTGGIAHDFNNLLMVISGYARRILSHPDDIEVAGKSLEQILSATEKAASLTKQLLVFSRRQIMEKRVFRVADALGEIKGLLVHSVGESHDVWIEVADKKVCVKTDQSEFSQAIMNLAVNARDAMPEGGEITIGARIEEVTEAATWLHGKIGPGRYVRISVTDRGTGIEEDTMAHLFEPFFTTKEQGKGTGLGLAMVYGFVEQSGGTIDVATELGVGTTFHIYLPVVEQAPEVAAAAQVALEHRGKGETILLVEDDDRLLELTHEVLCDLGYTVFVAGNGLEALELDENLDRSIDLLLSDVVMPSLGGFELYKILLEKRPELKAVFISGYPTRGTGSVEIPESTPFLSKPVSPEELAREIRDELDRSGSPHSGRGERMLSNVSA